MPTLVDGGSLLLPVVGGDEAWFYSAPTGANSSTDYFAEISKLSDDSYKRAHSAKDAVRPELMPDSALISRDSSLVTRQGKVATPRDVSSIAPNSLVGVQLLQFEGDTNTESDRPVKFSVLSTQDEYFVVRHTKALMLGTLVTKFSRSVDIDKALMPLGLERAFGTDWEIRKFEDFGIQDDVA